jgi:hypothetical protein
VYIGQTGRKLKTRVKDHRRDVRNLSRATALSEHCVDLDHRPALDKAEVVVLTNGFVQRSWKEAVNILIHDSISNKSSGAVKIPDQFVPLIMRAHSMKF